jgi:hypothetical protein
MPLALRLVAKNMTRSELIAKARLDPGYRRIRTLSLHTQLCPILWKFGEDGF